jgi:hypothetical protein
MATAGRCKVERARRFPLKIPINYLKSGMLDWQDGKTVNISATGLLFHADEKLEPDTLLDIRVLFSPKMTMSCQGPVVRAEKSAYAVHFHHYRLLRSEGPAPSAQ